ncbi:MAG: hypothetical protein JXA33_25830 [Anaerolineae bacterium]|nr:hypothetical protein [Anaerolineae bacterium]
MDTFPPFSQITYWWEYQTQGQTYETSQKTFIYEDNRFEWQTLQEDNITLHWVSGEQATMVTALDIIRTALAEIQYTLKTSSTDPITAYVYPSLADLQSALRLSMHTWVGGYAYPDTGALLLVIQSSTDAVLRMNNDIPHELTHKILYDMLGSQAYEVQPTWLLEGLASHFERSPDTTYALSLENARQNSSFIPLEQLCYPFPTETDQAILAYAQSQSLVNYLVQTYGWSDIRALLDAYADGLNCSAGIQQALDRDLTTLDREWRLSLEPDDQSDTALKKLWLTTKIMLRDLSPWLLLMGLILLPGILMLISAGWKRLPAEEASGLRMTTGRRSVK